MNRKGRRFASQNVVGLKMSTRALFDFDKEPDWRKLFARMLLIHSSSLAVTSASVGCSFDPYCSLYRLVELQTEAR